MSQPDSLFFSPLLVSGCIKNSYCIQFARVQKHLHSRASVLLHFKITVVFRFANLFKFYNLARNLSGPLSKWRHQLVSLVRTEPRCQNNTPWKTLRTLLLRKLSQWAGAEDSVSLFAVIFPRQITLGGRLERWSSSHHKEEGENQIAEFPILSLAEIWSNNPHQGRAMSVNFPIQWTMAQSRPSQSIEHRQGTRRNGISRGDLSLLKLFSNVILCYLHYQTGSGSQVEALAMGFQRDNWFPFFFFFF